MNRYKRVLILVWIGLKTGRWNFLLSKCNVLGMGKNNENRDHRIQGVMLKRVTQEKDLGVEIAMGGKQGSTVPGSYR